MNTKHLLGIALALGSFTACGDEIQGWQNPIAQLEPTHNEEKPEPVDSPESLNTDGPGLANPCISSAQTSAMTDVLPTGKFTAGQLIAPLTKELALAWVDGWQDTAAARAAEPHHPATVDIIIGSDEVEARVSTPVDPDGKYAYLCVSTFTMPVTVIVNRQDVLAATLTGTLTGNIDGSGLELSASAPLADVKGSVRPDYSWVTQNVAGFNLKSDGEPTTSLEFKAKIKTDSNELTAFDGQLEWFVDSVDTFLTFATLSPSNPQ